jgi:Zn-dependent protease
MKIGEIGQILIAVIVLAFTLSIVNLSLTRFLTAAIFLAIIFFVTIFAKKLMAYSLQGDIETSIWKFQRYGFYERSYFKTPIPIGIILPFLLSILTLGKVSWLASTQTEVTATKSRVAKRHGIYRYSEMTDGDMAWIISSGIFACIILAIISYIVGFPELSKLSILFACFNLIPLGNLDGTKLFFGNLYLWIVLSALSLVGLFLILFLV